MKFNSFDGQIKDKQIKRSVDNMRNRQNATNRHDPFNDQNDVQDLTVRLIFLTDLEWLSLNYRKQRAAKLSNSKRRMILLMF